MSEPPAPRCLCIVSGDPVRSAELLAALRTMESTHERLEIIVDRRRGKSGSGTNPPSADRRRQPSVDVKVKMDGFAIVPYPPTALAGLPLDDEVDPDESGLAVVPYPPPGWPLDDEVDPDEPEFARVLEFNNRRKARRRRRLALALLVGSTLAVLLLTQVPTMKALMSPTRLAAPPPAEPPSVIAMSSPLPPTEASPQSPPLPPTDASPQSDGSLRSPEPTPPAVERTGRPRAKPAGSPPMRRTKAPVHAGPAPMAVESPAVAPPPAEGAGGPGPAAQAATAAEVPAPRSQGDASTQRVGSVQSPEPGRSPEAAPTGQAPTATIPDASPASSGGAPSDQSVGGLLDQFKNLGSLVSRDASEANAEMKRQGDDLKVLQNRLRRAWDSVKQGFVGAAEKIRE
jgi:hypothetical protein